MSNPKWSVMIPTYNAALYISETLESVLAQIHDNIDLEIVVVDNCSTDETESIVKKIGPDYVRWARNSSNIGMINNFNECVRQASNEFIHILNADDVVKPGFYQILGNAFKSNPDIGLLACAAEVIDDNGDFLYNLPAVDTLAHATNDVSAFMQVNPLRTPAVAVRSSAYQKIGGFDPNISFAFDWDMWARLVFYCGGMQLPDILCKYREHGHNETSRVLKTGKNILDMWRVFEKFNSIGMPVDIFQARVMLKDMSKKQYDILKKENNPAYKELRTIHRKFSGLLSHIYWMYLK